MSCSITLDKEGERAYIHISQIKDLTNKGMRRALYDVGKDLKKTASDEILRRPKKGKVYRVTRGKVRRRHVASAPGESWANLSGAARRSIGYTVQGNRQLTFGAGSATVKHTRFVELGTSRMAARPALWNAIQAREGNTRMRFETLIEQELTQ